ncbi:MAG: toll/interleukin-1 receptor domain-containing protein [Roseiarcus sp.]
MADVFLSYSKTDRASADAVSKVLEENGLKVWTDAKLEPGDDFGDRVVAELAQAKAIVALVSDAYLASHWAQLELGAALAQSREHDVTVIPILLEGAGLPRFLSQFSSIDARNLPPEGVANKLRPFASRLPVHA